MAAAIVIGAALSESNDAVVLERASGVCEPVAEFDRNGALLASGKVIPQLSVEPFA